MKTPSKLKVLQRRQPQDFGVCVRNCMFCLVFGLKEKRKYEIALKTFDKLLSKSNAYSPATVSFTDSLVLCCF